MISALKFITWPAIAGLLAALLILDRFVLPAGQLEDGAASASVSYAKAVRLASPSVVTRMLLGQISRCTMCCRAPEVS